jgi:hypothetical protein
MNDDTTEEVGQEKWPTSLYRLDEPWATVVGILFWVAVIVAAVCSYRSHARMEAKKRDHSASDDEVIPEEPP